MTTSLKKYEGALDSIYKTNLKNRLLDDCYKAQNDFDESASCFKQFGDTWKLYSPTGYNRYENQDAVAILNSVSPSESIITRTGTAHNNLNDLSGVSYKDIFNSIAVSGYNQDISQFTKFKQDITDLSGALHNRGHFNHDIQTKYKNVNDLRSELDNKMRDIYNPEEQDAYRLHDQSIYMTLSWTILATSVLYYLFVKL